MKITANKYVAVIYDLNVGEGEEQELMEKATREDLRSRNDDSRL